VLKVDIFLSFGQGRYWKGKGREREKKAGMFEKI